MWACTSSNDVVGTQRWWVVVRGMLGCGRQGGKNAHVGRVLAGERNTHSMFGLLEFFLRGGIIHNRASGSERAVAKQTPSFPMTIASGFLATCRSRGRDRPNRCKVR